MDLPEELPKELLHLRIAGDSDALMEMLSSLPPDLITFFEYACEDAAWCSLHSDFMKSCIRWITLRSFDEKLLDKFALRAATAIRKNFSFVGEDLFYNVTFEVEGRAIEQNSLLWVTTSDYFHKLIRLAREKKSTTISMGNMPLEIFEQILEFVETGNVNNLWREGEKEIIEVFRNASNRDIPGLMNDCEILLKRYITPENAIEKLIIAHKNQWLHLKLTCMEFINNLNIGLYFDVEYIHDLVVEVLNFNRQTENKFDELKDVITHLVLSEYSDWIHRCTNLVGIGFCGSLEFNLKFLDIPENIKDLNLSRCVWLNGDYLKMFPSVCPGIKSLNLAQNYELTYDVWAVLVEFKHLEALDISRCHQVQNDDFDLIFRACRGLKRLTMIDCFQVNDAMFMEIGERMKGLTDLNISRCIISDVALIDLATKCEDLVTLNLSRCPNITEKGILEAVRHLPLLRELDISHNRIPPASIQTIKKTRPTLKVQA